MPNSQIIVGDCRESIKGLPDNSVDSIVTDPPYELGFMGKSWDASGIAYDVSLWRECLRVLKPGGHLLAFSGSRTYHRMTCAIEDAGFEIRDQIQWVYGSGFPKSHNVANSIDKKMWCPPRGRAIPVASTHFPTGKYAEEKLTGNKVEAYQARTEQGEKWDGWGTALKPAHEPICVARKPLEGTVADNVMKWGTGAINVDGCRVGTEDTTTRHNSSSSSFMTGKIGEEQPLQDTYQTGSTAGRWPANLIHDGSQEVLELFPETGPSKAAARGDGNPNPMSWGKGRSDSEEVRGHNDLGGSAARFFYCPKASKKDRDEGCEGMEAKVFSMSGNDSEKEGDIGLNKSIPRRNFHPTVKPTDLMRYLCRLVTPPGGTVLDPFTGSGSTGRGAALEGFNFIGCELSEDYAAIARARIAACLT